jgi:hypothetical protein
MKIQSTEITTSFYGPRGQVEQAEYLIEAKYPQASKNMRKIFEEFPQGQARLTLECNTMKPTNFKRLSIHLMNVFMI